MDLKIDMENKCIRIDGELYDLAKRGDYINYTSEIIGEQVVKELNFIKAKIDKKIEYYQSDKHQPTKDNIDVAKEDKLHWQCGDKHYQSSGNVVDEGLKASEGNWSWISKDKGLLGFLFQKEDKSYEFVKEKSELGIPDWVNQFSVIRTSPQPKSESIREYEIVDYTINPYERINEQHPFETHIKSVKRLSDSEVFSIGDEVVNAVGEEFKIQSFYITDDKIRVSISNKEGKYGDLPFRSLSKKPTVDDVKVEKEVEQYLDSWYAGMLETAKENFLRLKDLCVPKDNPQPPSDKGEVIQDKKTISYNELKDFIDNQHNIAGYTVPYLILEHFKPKQ